MDWTASLPVLLSRGIDRTLEFLGMNTPESDFQDADYFDRPVKDLVAARDVLLQFFPPELVYIILDLADYWVHTRSARVKLIQLPASRPSDANAAMYYLVTPPIMEGCQHKNETLRLKVARVEFTTVSHDQGWCSDAELRGEYFIVFRVSYRPWTF
jgi:hypothetical protein